MPAHGHVIFGRNTNDPFKYKDSHSYSWAQKASKLWRNKSTCFRGNIKLEETASAKWLIEEVKNRFQFSILTFRLFILTERKHQLRDAFFWWAPFCFFCCFDGYLSYPPSGSEWHRLFRNTGKQTSGGVQPFCSRGQHPQWDVASILWGPYGLYM